MPNKQKFRKKMKGGAAGEAQIISATPLTNDAATRKKYKKARAKQPHNAPNYKPTFDNYNKWAREGLTREQIRDREMTRRGNVGRNKKAGMNQRAAEKAAAEAYGGDAAPVAKSGGQSDYGSLNIKYFTYGITSIGIMGVLWFFLSRGMIRHEYSEALSYSIIALAIFLSFFLVLIAGLKSIRAGSGIMNGFKYLFKVILYAITKCLPAILICIQLFVLITICYKHADYLYNSETIPALFSTFNKMAAIMILGQSFVWYKQVNKIVLGESNRSNPALVPGFILAAILSGVAISQMYVILEYLKTDC
jgi:hypothetical protein